MFNQSKLRALGLLVAVFAAGAIAGWGYQAWADSRNSGRSRPRGLDATVEYLDRELTLTPVQKDSVRAAFERHKPEMDALWQSVHPKFDSIRAQVRTEIKTQLTPAQQARYQEMIEAADRRHRAADSTRQRQ